MKYTQAKLGRSFVMKLDDHDTLPDVIEQFAVKQNILTGFCLFLGGARSRSRIVVGPERENQLPPTPITLQLQAAHETIGWGAIIPDQDGKPKLHAHAAFGHGEQTKTGCIRPGIHTWKVMELIVQELIDCDAKRLLDAETGFSLLEP